MLVYPSENDQEVRENSWKIGDALRSLLPPNISERIEDRFWSAWIPLGSKSNGSDLLSSLNIADIAIITDDDNLQDIYDMFGSES